MNKVILVDNFKSLGLAQIQHNKEKETFNDNFARKKNL